MTEIRRVGVIGAGQMGRGIAQVCAMHGFEVVLTDLSRAQLAAANDQIGRQLDRAGLEAPGRDAVLARITGAHSLDRLAHVDLAIEAVSEDASAKLAIFSQLAQVMNPMAILATNTSSLSVTGLAAGARRADRFIGLHFMNPVPRMELVEVIRGAATSDETAAICARFVQSLGKTAVASADYPAFIVNRILISMINEAVFTLYEGVGGVEAIDAALRLGANHPMGPLQLADLIGLDTVLAIMNSLYLGLADSKYRPCPLLVKYVEAGWLGRKSGRGFYDYQQTPPHPTR